MIRLSSMLIVGLLLAASAQASVILVGRGGGHDARSIQDGVDLAGAGDEVRVDPGVYTENVIMKSGVRLVSVEGPAATTINGRGDTCVRFIQCAQGSAILGFTLTNGGGDTAGAVYVFDGSHVEVGDNIIRDNETSYEGAGVQVQRYAYAYIHDNQFLDNRSYHACAIVVIVGSQALIEQNVFRGNVSAFLSAGIGVNLGNVQIRYNRFIGNISYHGATVHAVNTGSFATIIGNSFVQNEGVDDGGSGIYVYDGAVMTAENNIFALNRGTAAILCRNARLVLICNDIWGNDIDCLGIADPVGVDGNIGLDPLLCMPITDDLAVSGDSPCLRAACGVIGVNPTPACSNVSPLERRSLSAVKSDYR